MFQALRKGSSIVWRIFGDYRNVIGIYDSENIIFGLTKKSSMFQMLWKSQNMDFYIVRCEERKVYEIKMKKRKKGIKFVCL